jgi:predicted nucleotidyltransferase component of viral defense system
MTFHESAAFSDAILAASEALQIRPVLVEKDYWVTYILKNLSLSSYSEKVVFKGGTSLSKGYNCIKRFSEDIDLALLPQAGLTGNQVKNLLSKIDHTITVGLEYVDGEKRGRNRTSSYNYPKVLTTGEFGAVKEHIKVEINSFTNPVPHSSLPISSYLYQFLLQRQNTELIRQYNLEPFPLYVLSLERTFFEKLLSLNRLSYNGIETLKTKIRHFYDLHELYHNTHLKDSIFTDQNFEILKLVKLDDESIQTFHGEWMGKTFASSPLFSSLENTWNNLSPQYLSELGNLIWADKLPEPAAILSVMQKAKAFLEQYDKIKS